jgi:hypothetical protein
MNAESTAFRSSRPAVVLAPGGEGTRAAAWLLSWPMRLAATPIGRRVLAAVALAVVAVAGVGYLYDSADQPRQAALFRPAGLAAEAAGATKAAAVDRQAAASPVRAKRAATAAEAAAAWWAARQKVDLGKVRPLQQRRVSATEVQVLVVAEEAGSRMPSEYVTVRKGPSGWKVP